MFRHRYIKAYLLCLISGIALIGCSDDLLLQQEGDGSPDGLKPGILRAQIYFHDYEEGRVATRFTQDPNDGWSIGGSSVTFTDADTVGIFSRWGNMNLPTKDGRGGPLINVPMYFVKQEYPKDPNNPAAGVTIAYTLENDTVEVFPPAMKSGNGLFMYYPYTPDAGNLRNYPNWREYVDVQNYQTGSMYWGTGYNNSPTTQLPDLSGRPGEVFPEIPGLELRVKAPDGSLRCRDVVEMFNASTADLTKGIISGAVYHTFSELIITRGEGFDNPMRKQDDGTLVPDYTIYVTLTQPLSHLRVISYSDFVRWTTQLFYDPDYELDEEEAKKWYAWEGGPYPFTATPTQPQKRAWYVIVPSIYHQNNSASWNGHSNRIYASQYSTRPTVSEICLYDNDGYLQHVTSFTLKTSDTATPTKMPYPYHRWPIEIAMDELGAIARPVTIENWDEDREDKDITDVRTAGIHNMEEFQQWASLYSSYIDDGRVNDEGLSAYGDRIDNVWHFYVSGYDFAGQQLPYVSDLQDVIEGNNQFFNVVWSNLKLTAPMFGKISGHGGIKNLDILNPTLNYQATEPVGILAKEIDFNTLNEAEKTLDNCNIYNGTVFSDGLAGMLAGTIQFGRIANCEFSGKVISAGTSSNPRNLFGREPVQDLNITNTSYTNIIYGAQ